MRGSQGDRWRGEPWLKEGQGIGWEDIAKDIGVSKIHIRELKKMANYQSGVRHATKNGSKIRANVENYGTWVSGLIDAINAARVRLEPGFKRMTPEQVGKAVMKAVPVVPYP